MKICVCGWYFREDFYRVLKRVNERYPVAVVSNTGFLTASESVLARSLDFYTRENIGLEWGAYDYYLKEVWDGVSPVLFLHDDIRLRPVMKDYELRPPVEIFDAISKFEHDQVYIFKSLPEAKENFWIHGRAFYCSARFLRYLRRYNDGFWFDEDNDGHTQGPTPAHCKHFNEADYQFKYFTRGIPEKSNMKAGGYVILPALDCARRGRFEEEIEASKSI